MTELWAGAAVTLGVQYAIGFAVVGAMAWREANPGKLADPPKKWQYRPMGRVIVGVVNGALWPYLAVQWMRE